MLSETKIPEILTFNSQRSKMNKVFEKKIFKFHVRKLEVDQVAKKKNSTLITKVTSDFTFARYKSTSAKEARRKTRSC